MLFVVNLYNLYTLGPWMCVPCRLAGSVVWDVQGLIREDRAVESVESEQSMCTYTSDAATG